MKRKNGQEKKDIQMGKGTWGKTGVRKDQRKYQSCKRSKSAAGNQPILCLKEAFQVWLFASSLFFISILINSHFQLFFWVFGLLVSVDIIGHSFVLWDSGYACSVSDLFWAFFTSLENIWCSVPSHNLIYQNHAFICWDIRNVFLISFSVEILGMFRY